MIWGIWDVSLDTSTGIFDVVPVRGIEFKANVTMFLQPPKGSLMFLNFENFDLSEYMTEGILELDVGLTHPFPGLNQYTGFDVLGVFMHGGADHSVYDPVLNWAGNTPDVARLLNADGYTRWFNVEEFPQPGIFGYTEGALGSPGFVPEAFIQPFKYFADHLDFDQDLSEFFTDQGNCDNRGCFRPGETNKRHYVLQFPMGGGGTPQLLFQYAVFASWEPPLDELPGNPVEDFPINANMAECLVLAGDFDGTDVYYVNETTYGGDFRLELEILDHQGALTGSGVTVDIGGLVIESIGSLFPGGYQFYDQAELQLLALPGGPSSSVYIFEITNCIPEDSQDKPILVTVLSQDPTTYDSGVPGFPYPEEAALASYWAGSISIIEEISNLPPIVGDLFLYWECPDDPCAGQEFSVEITEAYDPEGQPVTITWDFDGNMDYLDDLDGDDTNLSGNYVYDIPGIYECYCRVDDGEYHVDVGPLSITVQDCVPDVPEVEKEVPGLVSGWISYDVAYNPDDGYAYLAYSTGDGGSLAVVDVDPIADASFTGSVDFDYLQLAIACKGTWVYVGGVYLNGISTIDASDPTDPIVVGTYYQGLSNAMINDLEIVGDYLYAAAQWGGILVFDITTPSSPVFVGQTPGGFGTVINSSAVAVTEDNLWGFYTDGYEVNPNYDDYVKVVDLSDPSSPTVVNEIMVQFHFYSDMALQGDYLYLTETGWFTVLDISYLPAIDIVFTSNTGFGGNQYDIAVAGSYVYMVNGIWGDGMLTVIDVTDPELPVPFTSLALPGGGQGLDEYCGELYIAASYNLLDIVDLY